MDGIVRQGLSRRQGVLVLLLGCLLLLLATRGAAREQPALLRPAPRGDAGLSVMTYNVEGLPWPARFGRGAALARIGERLAALRAAGAQPRIVLLQEAFSDDAKAIRTASGYPYAAIGPDSAPAGPSALPPSTAPSRPKPPS
jgi:hypothetical protein